MTDLSGRARPTPDNLFADLPGTAEAHYRIYHFGAVLTLLHHLASSLPSWSAIFEKFPFLAAYNDQLAGRLAGTLSTEAISLWWQALERWESKVPSHLPLRALRTRAELDHRSVGALVGIALAEEDSVFGELLDHAQGTSGAHRPTAQFTRHVFAAHLSANFYGVLEAWRKCGMVQVANPDAPRQDWLLTLTPWLADLIRTGYSTFLPEGLLHSELETLPLLDAVILPETIQKKVSSATTSAWQTPFALVIRGPTENGRRMLLGAWARSIGRGLIHCASPEPELWQSAEVAATLLNAVPVLEYNLALGETAVVPLNALRSGVFGIILGKHGAIKLPSEGRTLHIDLPAPDAKRRAELWRRFAPGANIETSFTNHFRLTSGTIHRVAREAASEAEAAGNGAIEWTHLRVALRNTQSRSLETLARHVPARPDKESLSVWERTAEELNHFESRCRERERLATSNPGVRALFYGPSGTGKTLAAHRSAAALQKELYQIDLSAVVNKYIGETEKNLNRLFDLAEDLDVVLLLDEGDALLTRRTDVQTSNDRYANLETNFLLQRIESFEGIVIITTNTRERIDPAFERRMDCVVEFVPPGPEERRIIWYDHLPQNHIVSCETVDEIASRCSLSGGQIRNAALHAHLLALGNGGIVTTDYVQAAVRREYSKIGSTCPLRG